MGAPTIDTPRLRLRPWRASDREGWVAMSADPRVMEFFPRTLDRTEALEQVDRFAKRLHDDGYGFWALEIANGAPFAGIIALIDVPSDLPFAPALEVGWRLAPEAWGNGYATEGARALLDFAFATLGREEVVSMTAASNVRSRRVMVKLGMTRDPADDFDHPRVPVASPLRRHVLYRIGRTVTRTLER